MRTARDRLLEHIAAAGGPVPFSTAVEVALYDEQAGFYATGGRAGRRGDFLTSPEVGPLFGTVVAGALDAWWREAGAPDPCTFVDAGAGPGALTRSLLAAGPACAGALRCVLVERAAAQREAHRDLVERWPGIVTSQAELPEPGGPPAFVVANELLDNLPFDLLERTADGWAEVRVGTAGDDAADPRALAEVLVALAPSEAAGRVPEVAAAALVGARVPVQTAAVDWLGAARLVAGPQGRVVVLDYASTSDDLAGRPPQEWLRTYRRHERGGPPLAALGEQDVTCEVCLDQLEATGPPRSVTTQAEWLRRHGIERLVDEGRRIWEQTAHIGDLASVRARSRVVEGHALCDLSGLGAFCVGEWQGA